MDITKQQLKQAIKEELKNVLNEEKQDSTLAWAKQQIQKDVEAGRDLRGYQEFARTGLKKYMTEVIRKMKVMNLALENARQEGKTHTFLYRQFKLAEQSAAKVRDAIANAKRMEALLLAAANPPKQPKQWKSGDVAEWPKEKSGRPKAFFESIEQDV